MRRWRRGYGRPAADASPREHTIHHMKLGISKEKSAIRERGARTQLGCVALVAALLLLLAPSWGAPQAAPNAGFRADGKIRIDEASGLREAYLPMLFPSSHAANLLALRNGDLLCAWFSGTREGASDVAIVVARLKRGSDQWSAPEVVDQQEGRSYQNPVLFEVPDGKIWLFHSSQEADKGESHANILVLTSDDGGETWSSAKPAFTKPGAFTRQPMVVLPNGDWMLPMYFAGGGPKAANSSSTAYPAMQVSSDHGVSWKEYDVPDAAGLVQPVVLQLAAHRFVAFFRSRAADWIYRSTSADGVMWSAPVRTALPNNNASIGAARLKDGRIAMAFNNCSALDAPAGTQKAPRKPLSIALSADGGVTWPWVRDVQTGDEPGAAQAGGSDEYSYPAIVQSADGSILLAYTFRRLTIKYVVMDEGWIESGGTAGRYQGNARRGAPGKP